MLAFVAAAALAPATQAAATWNMDSCTQNAVNQNNFGNSYSCSGGSGNPSITATGWSNTGSWYSFADAYIAEYAGGGFGVKSRAEGLSATSPDHAIDSSGSTDALLLSFSQTVALNSIKLGWTNVDSDVSLLRYTGSGSPVSGTSINTSSGWELVGHYPDVPTNVATTVNPGNKTSSWWLISAFDWNNGGPFPSTPMTMGDDYFKVLAVAATPGTLISNGGGSAPEPSSLALAAMGLFGAGYARYGRRTTRS
ncbi:MAG TPA: exosortase-dependent surface protein XDP1 [Burkholderiaceae bacterium]|nr:exosortase-dependent surface protein XDP1 [Burkholderiaceae bacterium]